MSEQGQENINNVRTKNKKVEDTELVEILRRKVTNFMKVIAHSVRQNSYTHQNDNLHIYLSNTEDGAQQVELSDNTYDKALDKINNNIKDGEYADEYQIKILATLLFNNGYPYVIHVKSIGSTNTTKYPDNNIALMYHMHLRFENKHYDVEVDVKINENIAPEILKNYTIDANNIIKIFGDGSCFYRSIAVWCRFYGITADHLNSLNYNIPFEYDIDSFNKNLKVNVGKPSENIVAPISVDFHKYDDSKIQTIATELKNKLLADDLKQQVENNDDKNIIPTDEYIAKQLGSNNNNKSCYENIRVKKE
jgi:hypothetical protein